MFQPKENPVETVQEAADIMRFVNESLNKMQPNEFLSKEAMAGLQCLLIKIEKNLNIAGGELAMWRKVSGSTTKLPSEPLSESKKKNIQVAVNTPR